MYVICSSAFSYAFEIRKPFFASVGPYHAKALSIVLCRHDLEVGNTAADFSCKLGMSTE